MGGVVEALGSMVGRENVYWIGEHKSADLDIFDLFYFRFKDSFRNHGFENLQIPRDLYQFCYRDYDLFAEMYSRNHRFNEYELHDLRDAFNLYLDFFYKLYTAFGFNQVILANLPHEGPEFILYKLAQFYQLKTILNYQSLFPNKFFCVSSIGDFGTFETSPNSKDSYRVSVNKEMDFKPFYMSDAQAYENRKKQFRISSLKTFKENRRAAVLSYFRYRAYYKRLDESIDGRLEDLPRQKFLYFPLHLQPELTTSTLGHEYFDQLLALERLSQLIPSDMKIYVKENPKQTYYNRGPLFFKRLKRIKNVVMVHPDTSTHELINQSSGVATISGTAGWEGLLRGKKVIAFGNPWYLSLSGVLSFSKLKSFSEFEECRFDVDSLQRTLDSLSLKLSDGVIDYLYKSLIPDYDHAKNCRQVATFFVQQLEQNS